MTSRSGPGRSARWWWTGEHVWVTWDAEGRRVVQRDPVAAGRYEIVSYVGQFRLAVSPPVEVEVRGE